tara:strand:- start:158 stop:820 length:663 start_codon:yes stop_codon:yes gene_type:complete
MHFTIKNLLKINENVKINVSNENKKLEYPKIIAVSKTFKIDQIIHLINFGHLHYGENKVQEAVEKWSEIKTEKKNIKLHLIGRLQTNKVKMAIKIFDYIHSLDNRKLADKISLHQKENNLDRKIFIQVNIGNEDQKSGIPENELYDFYQYCKSIKLNILGLMCIPPFNENSSEYFIRMNDLNKKIGLTELSMGMSSDYINAVKYGSTFVRIGSDIFGPRY